MYGDIICDGVRQGQVGQPIAQNSVFGWVISGPVNSPVDDNSSLSANHVISRALPRISSHHIFSAPSLEQELRRFWEIEEIPRQTSLSLDEQQCEEHFRATHIRDSDGRYIVRLPFKKGPPIDIGHSKLKAERFLNKLLIRYYDKPQLKQEYHDFLAEYESLGHMRAALPQQPHNEQSVYIPHHGVVHATSASSHLRVVFNASSRTSNGTSLNDHLFSGPKLQTDITSVILRWRQFQYVYSADIAKMYRQIRVDERDIHYQHILWQPSSSDVYKEFQLLTVTYGMTCAPFLALRILK